MIAQKPLPRSKFASVAERLFFCRYTDDVREIAFGNADVEAAADELGYAVDEQLSDFFIAYVFHKPLPRSIRATAPRDFEWRMINDSPDRYRFALRTNFCVIPDKMVAEYKVNEGMIGERQPCSQMSKGELFEVIHANRLVERFTGLRCMSQEMDVCAEVLLGFGTAETIRLTIDVLLFGESQQGTQYVMPIYYASENEPLNSQAIDLHSRLLRNRYPNFIYSPLAAQGIGENVIALFSLEIGYDGIRKGPERHYRLIRTADTQCIA